MIVVKNTFISIVRTDEEGCVRSNSFPLHYFSKWNKINGATSELKPDISVMEMPLRDTSNSLKTCSGPSSETSSSIRESVSHDIHAILRPLRSAPSLMTPCGSDALEDHDDVRDAGECCLEKFASKDHTNGICQPCMFRHKPQGCKKGSRCEFCHFCDENKANLFRLKKRKETRRRVSSVYKTY
eukprot:GEMP01069987.1.p1 GENE.GEMP01069987.1~~GEMP01069987.1.p1  ORF type:complete len:191 (+),score=17.45 GEMP01069987.1:22-573(+)